MRKLFILSVLFCSLSYVQAQTYNMVVTSKGGVQYTIPATDVVSVSFEQAAETIGPLPAGFNISALFEDAATQAILTKYNNINILLSEGTYTLPKDIEVPSHVHFAITGLGSGSTIKMGNATLIVGNAFQLNNLTIDATNSTKPLVTLSSSPDESLKGATGGGSYYNVIKPFEIKNCTVKGLKNVIVSDNGTAYCLGNVLVDNCLLELNSQGVSGIALVDMRNGGINDLTISNSTIYQTGEEDVKYLIQYNNGYRCDRAGYNRNSVRIINNTLYKVCKSGQLCNYSGIAGRNTSDWEMRNNIFYDVSSGETARRFLGGRQNQATAIFDRNNYWYEGADENCEGYDTSSTIVLGDPSFADAPNGNFEVNGQPHRDYKIGDPRWYPVEEAEE